MEKDSNASTFEEAHGIGLDEAGNPIPVTVEFDDLCSDIICAICKRECFTVAHTVMHVRDEHQIRGLDDVEASFLQLTIAKIVKIEPRYALDKCFKALNFNA